MITMDFLLLIILSLEIFSKKTLIKNKLISLLDSFSNNDEYTAKRFNNSNALVFYNLYDQFQKYFKIHSNDSDDSECWDSIFNNMVADYDYSIIYFYSGHKLTEIGDEELCIKEKNTYLLTLLTYDINETSIKIQDKMSLFSSKENYNLGICIWKDCNNFINKALINNIDKI